MSSPLWQKLRQDHGPVSAIVSTCAVLIMFVTLIWSIISQPSNNEELIQKYTDILKGEIKNEIKDELSEFDATISRLVERNGKTQSGETIRKIIASHENIQRGRDDTYKKVIADTCVLGYIFEIDQSVGKSGFYMTGKNWKRGDADTEGSSFLLSDEEKKHIDELLEPYFNKEKTNKRIEEFANRDAQKDIFFYLLQESSFGSIVDSPEFKVRYWTAYNEKIRFLEPLAKLGAVIGYIGDMVSAEIEPTDGS